MISRVAEPYSSATDIEVTRGELIEAGERIWNLFEATGVREGLGRKDDRFPDKWFTPLRRPDRGGELPLRDYFDNAVISTDDAEKILDHYYEEHGWDVKRGIPTKRSF